MSNRSLLITRPRYDNLTTYLYFWAKSIIEIAKNKGWSVLDLADSKASKEMLESYLSRNKPSLVYLNGHGNETSITGQDEKVLLQEGQNKNLLKDCITYALSCSVGAILGKSLVKNGTKAFIGYDSPYILLTDSHYNTRPLDDPVAQLFLKPSNLVMVSLIKGNTARQSFDKARNAYIKNLSLSLSSAASQQQINVAPYLFSDIKSFVIHERESI